MNHAIPSELDRTRPALPIEPFEPLEHLEHLEQPSPKASSGVDERTSAAAEPPPTCLDLAEACGAALFLEDPEEEEATPSRAASLLWRGAFVLLTVASLAAAAVVIVLLMSGRLEDLVGATARSLRTALCAAALLAWRSLLAHEAASLTRFLDGASARRVEALRALLVAGGPLLFCAPILITA